MNKVLTINLGGYPFTIDEDAYDQLSDYLNSIHAHFKVYEGYEEITTDIEVRLAELFQEQLLGRPIVTTKEVEQTISIMGTPEEFGATEEEEDATGEPKQSISYTTGKRFAPL